MIDACNYYYLFDKSIRWAQNLQRFENLQCVMPGETFYAITTRLYIFSAEQIHFGVGFCWSYSTIFQPKSCQYIYIHLLIPVDVDLLAFKGKSVLNVKSIP